MVEKIGTIKNPLTIIAIFAAIAEISGTVVLPFIAEANQSTYVWFLIAFPFLLISLFFLTLNFNHRVLYAPSDYQNEDNFIRSLECASFAEKALKIKEELASIEEAAEAPISQQPTESNVAPSPTETSTQTYQAIVPRSAKASYMLAEELIFQKLQKEFSTKILREVRLAAPITRYVFDGIVQDKGVITAIEVKFMQNTSNLIIAKLKGTLASIHDSVKRLENDEIANFRVLLAIATDGPSVNQDKVAAQIDKYRGEFPFPIEVRFYNLTELEREFKSTASGLYP